MKAQILDIDVAWNYPNNQNNQATSDFHAYPKLTLDECKRLPVPDLLDPSGVAFMWYTGPMATDCGELVRAWGWEVINWFGFVWVKLNPTGTIETNGRTITVQNGFYGYGAGGYTITNVEAVAICRPKRRAAPVERVDATQHQLVFSPVGRASRKPSEVMRRIERIYDMPGRRIVGVELFATELNPGWISLGNQINGQDIRDTLPALIAAPSVSYEDAMTYSGDSLQAAIWKCRVVDEPKIKRSHGFCDTYLHHTHDDRYVLGYGLADQIAPDGWVYNRWTDALSAFNTWNPRIGEPSGWNERYVPDADQI